MAFDVKFDNKERYLNAPELTREEVEAAIEQAIARLRPNLERFRGAFPLPTTGWYMKTEDKTKGWSRYRYDTTDVPNWTSAMWTGVYWLAYELTGDEAFRDVAESHFPIFEKAINEMIGMDDHDIGFKYSPSCVAEYMITGNEKAKVAALKAADELLEHICPVNHFVIRAGKNEPGRAKSLYRSLVDSMLNIPLLFWAHKETGDNKYMEAAVLHYKETTKRLIKNDGSSYHHYQYNPETHEPEKGVTLQGNRDESVWTRGQSWLVYGYPIAYDYTHDEELIDIHKAVTYYFLNNLPSDLVPYWDFDFNDGSFEPRDASASAIVCCGLMEMCRHLPDDSEDKVLFTKAADALLRALIERCTDMDWPSDALLAHVTASKPHNMQIDESATYGDYFYLEALMRKLNPDWKRYW